MTRVAPAGVESQARHRDEIARVGRADELVERRRRDRQLHCFAGSGETVEVGGLVGARKRSDTAGASGRAGARRMSEMETVPPFGESTVTTPKSRSVFFTSWWAWRTTPRALAEAVSEAVGAAKAGEAASVAASAARQTLKRILIPHFSKFEASPMRRRAFTSIESLWLAGN